ncbi:hypothetical protein IHE45_05G042200 [Dioscorea alata]|uniref:Uncharacterized protein n=3 Tax=Dioscorea alata TaxID=55571 RepID=A0ACB7W0W5_DIOAL|nr:hypothetical protein IHE45_05G042200 [Dioscorea alata]KAH7681166.1 hypothetical protein IHE45_05G042200 [Dioscorea alata]KAH7681167.1 hypothetical protein IHE45_05G042200 [Dioscorea alata]
MALEQVPVSVEEVKNAEVPVKSEPEEENVDLKAEVVEDGEIDVVGFGDGADVYPVQGDDPDATEHSSSFGETFSGCGDGGNSSSSDAEVESRVEQHSLSNGVHRICRKKKITDHWRNFVRPLMWRCQWLELRMNELHSQALKYDNELAKYTQEKQLHSTMVGLDGSASRMVPLSCGSRKNQVMKRRKRKRNEETVDTASYMSQHNIFSYYENKRSEIDRHSIDDDCGDPVDERNRSTDVFEALNEWLMFGGRDASLEQILLNIDVVQSRIVKLRNRLDSLMKANNRELAVSQGFPGSGETRHSHALSPSCSPRNNGDIKLHGALNTPPHHVSEHETEDAALPGSTVSSYGDAAEPDIVVSTLDLLSAAPSSQHHFGNSSKENAEEVLIINQTADEELQNFDKVKQNHELVKEEAESSSSDESTAPELSVSGPGSEKEKPNTTQQSVLKPCYSGKKRGRKPKRKRRGGVVGNWKSERLKKRKMA